MTDPLAIAVRVAAPPPPATDQHGLPGATGEEDRLTGQRRGQVAIAVQSAPPTALAADERDQCGPTEAGAP
jgi:hypothetical protein